MLEPTNGESEQLTFGEEASVSPAPFVMAAGGAKELVPVRISLAIIERFSEGLYSSPNKTFEELVSNSYDAGAERVWVYMPPDLATSGASILVIDDGLSMDIQGLQDLWRIGKSKKRDEGQPKGKREPIGKFGIGKLATYVLAEELTYIVLKDGVYRAVTMDYQMVQGEMSDPHTLNLEAVELTRDEAQEALLTNLRDYGVRMKTVMESLFPEGDSGPLHWTAAVMTRLKKPAQGIQQGRLRWVLSSAIPLNPSFSLFYNGDEIEPSKAQGEELWRFTVGESEESLPSDRQIGEPTQIEVAGEKLPAYKLPLAGTVWGHAQLFQDSLQRGRSEQLGRSHGFFVRVRNRLINLDDANFNVGPELSHGTFSRFNMVINADDLDSLVASPRESLQDSPEVRELRTYMLAVFNRARSALQSLDERDNIPLLSKQGRISNPPPGLTQGPLRRMLRRASQGDQAVRDTLGIKTDAARIPETLVEGEGEILEQVLVEPMSEEARLISYDPDRRAAVLNQSHPFISNYIDNQGTQEALQLLGLTELLTQAYMLDENIDAETVHRIMRRRDAFLRDLVSYHPRSAPVIARNLRMSSNDEKALEDAVADALQVMGYHVQRVGGKGTPDGIATVRLGRRAQDFSESYALTYDAKSSGKDARKLLAPDKTPVVAKPARIQAGTARTSVLRVHRERAAGQFNLEVAPAYTLLVAPGFQGDGDDTALIGDICRNDGITPITVDDLARLVELFPLRRMSPVQLRSLFSIHSPEGARAFVDEIEGRVPPAAPPVAEVIDLLVQYSERRTPVTIDTIVTAIFERRRIDLDHEEAAAIVRGLAALAPATMYFDGQLVALNATPQGLIGELNQTLGEYPSRLADAYRIAVPGVPQQRVEDK
ncbi:ATP-binding protein [Streptomyces sp. NBC_00047]|uniref:ATP-binding protein n=1 Tax=Streptomyces sp. NBC_00047 TaxID=2975627 RepID=UPI00225940FD|nr:ATP-binding protein [Streptomyces sp. NBC_00047]MCX5607886.1 ATP-binding protein [Streptomyces sp. NBC_00047]